MNILLTGAFGNLGLRVLRQALALGYNVRCFDLDTPRTRKQARAYAKRCDPRFGDLLHADFPALLDGIDAVVHTVALLPPATERQPELARQINVAACQRLIDACAARDKPPHFVYPSSLSVFAKTDDRPRPRRVDDPVAATDVYTEHKLAVEAHLKARDLPWSILRVGVAVDAHALSTDRQTFARLLATSADNPLEYVHPRDVALAICRSLETPAARGKTLLIGGGPACQVTQARFMGAAFRALGLRYPAHVHGQDYFYTHWLDTAESQALLDYQHNDFAVYERELRQRLRHMRAALFPFRWLINPLLGPLLKRI